MQERRGVSVVNDPLSHYSGVKDTFTITRVTEVVRRRQKSVDAHSYRYPSPVCHLVVDSWITLANFEWNVDGHNE